MKKFLSSLFPERCGLAISALVGTAAASLYYLVFLQRHFFSWRYTVTTLAIAAGATLLAAWWNQKVLYRLHYSLSKPIRRFSIVFCLLLSALLLMQTHFQPFYFLLPESDLAIRFTSGDIPEGAEGIRLLGLRTKWGFEPFTRLLIEGEWARDGVNLLFEGSQEAAITWRGRVGPWAEITFRRTPYDQPVTVNWDRAASIYNLADPENETITIVREFPVAWFFYLPYALSFLVSAGYLLFNLLTLLGSWQPSRQARRQPTRFGWLAYTLPMLAAWTFTLLVFWPGSLSPDSTAQWGQALRGSYNNWQPVFHTFIVALLMRVWYSPAIVALTQIILSALVAAWGFKVLRDYGAPPLVPWVISFLYALSPINNIQNITLWKDILYAVSMLWLTILLLQVFLSEGESMRGARGWAALGVAAFCVAIFRKNGFPVALFSLAFLPLFYRRRWKEALAGLLVAAGLYLGVTGPLYTLMNVKSVSTGQTNLILLHHLGAHVDSGTPLRPEEKEYLESFLPLEDWNYSCCNLTTVSYYHAFDRQRFLDSGDQNRKLALALFLRDPLVDIKHNLCAGDMVWRFANNQCIIKTTHAFGRISPREERWVLSNEYGVREDSRFPALVTPYIAWLRQFGFWDETLAVYLRPALWMVVSLFCLAVLVVRRQDLKGWVAGLPVIGQSGLMFLITFAPKFRYHYSMLLIGFFSLGLLFIAGKKNPPEGAGSAD
jgi:hypothetical protein